MEITTAQEDMRHAYYSGAAGILVSATVWFVAGGVARLDSPSRAVWALLVGGMLIHPAAVLLAKALGRPGTHTPGNPLAGLALEGTVFFLLAIVPAYALSRYHIEWFFPAMLLLIGGRYLTFSTLYGLRAYWAGGSLLAAAGMLTAYSQAPAWVAALAGALIEYVFAAVVVATVRRGRPASARRAG
jgi:ABC-type xylose transport system permease subunit